MTEKNMPVTEAVVESDEREPLTYELAYHVLPTVAEGEVVTVSDTVKRFITSHGGSITDEEVATRFELAYEIEKYLEGKYRRFNSAYFGWIRFTIDPASIAALSTDIEGEKNLLRHLLIRLTKVEEANPFRFHEAIKDTKVTTIDLDEEVVDEVVTEEEVVDEVVTEEEVVDETVDTADVPVDEVVVKA